jgi:WD40 repeat protein
LGTGDGRANLYNLSSILRSVQQQQKKKKSSSDDDTSAKPHSRELVPSSPSRPPARALAADQRLTLARAPCDHTQGLYTQRSKGEGRPIYNVARSRDGRYLVASGCDNLVHIWHRPS